jgi:predicted DNA-binding transcriptional regulator YafY
MSKTARLYKIEALMREHGEVSFKQLLAALEVSAATIKRDLEYLRSQLGAPISYDAASRSYRFAASTRQPRHELPGLWFDERELYALLTAYQLLGELDSNGILSRHLQPLRERIQQLLGQGDALRASALHERVKVINAFRRPVPGEYFELITAALTTRRRVQMRYLTRGRQERGDREVSPQRLVHYRNTWYLDAWCHRAKGLRRFALDAIEHVVLVELAAKDVAMQEVQAEMDGGYGIYAGGQQQWAELLFSPRAAAWISREEWHPQQVGAWQDDGSYLLRLPYVDDTELVMDLLRQAEQVKVLAPQALRLKLRSRLRAALEAS